VGQKALTPPRFPAFVLYFKFLNLQLKLILSGWWSGAYRAMDTEVADVVRGDPGPALFQAPGGYEVVDYMGQKLR